jgi:hypothetical protein
LFYSIIIIADTAAEKDERKSVAKAGETHGKSPSPGLGNWTIQDFQDGSGGGTAVFGTDSH